MTPDTRIADLSMYNVTYHGDPYNYDQLYDPAYYTVEIDWALVAANVSGLLLRVGIGSRKDPVFDRLRAAAIQYGIPFGIYHAYNPFEAPQLQANLIVQWCPTYPQLGVWGDIEMGNAIAAVTLVYLAMLDHEYSHTTGIYSGGPYLDAHFTPAQQAQLEWRLLWIAGYPNFWPPYAWNKGANHALHQYTDKYPLPGLAKPCDMSIIGPTWPYGSPPMSTILPGAGHGFHGEASNQIIPIIERGLTLGIHYKVFNSVHNPGRLRDAWDRDHNILTISRFKQPHTALGERWENGQDMEVWSQDEHLAAARSSIQLLFDNTNAWERGGIKLYTPGINEVNLTGWAADWTCIGQHMHLLIDEAERREQEFGFPIRLGIPGIAQGKPEYHQMRQMIATGIFDRMATRGDRFTVHAGRYRWETSPEIPGLGVVIPGAPSCPPYGGSGDGRVNYFYAMGIRCRFVLTEAYDGLDEMVEPAIRTPRMKQTDDLYRHNPYYDGICWYECVDNKDSPWEDTDFTPTFRSNVFEKEMQAQALVANPTPGPAPVPEDPMPYYTDSQVASLRGLFNGQIASSNTGLGILAAGHTYKAGDVVLANTNPLVTYVSPGGAVKDKRPATPPGGDMIAYDLNVIAVSADNLWLEVAAGLWVKGTDVVLKKAAA